MEGIDVIRRMYDAWNRGEVDSAVEKWVHPEVVWRASGLFPGMEPVYHGRDGVRQFERDLRTPFSTFHVTVEEERPEGDAIVTRARFDAVGAESGVSVQVWFDNIWHVQDGLVVSFQSRPAG